MNARGVFFLGMRYLGRNRAKTILLVSAFALVWLLPATISLVVAKVEDHLRMRALATPLVLGQAGSALELTFNALYFTKPDLPTLPVRDVRLLRETGWVEAIPIYARFSAGGTRIVGTTLDYFRWRGLAHAEGRPLLRLGECVVGATVARENGISVGDAIISSPETLFDLAGVYPLKMTVCGILEPSGTADDRVIFVDLKTTWIIEGLGHGHEEAQGAGEDQQLGGREGEGVIRLNASVEEFNEITPENTELFHFHGDLEEYPITAVVAVPGNARDQALIKGRYAGSSTRQLVTPAEEMDELFATVFSVQRFVLGLLVAVGIATLAIGALVFVLSHRLRRDEFHHLRTLGASPRMLKSLVAFEAAFVVLGSLLVSGLLLWAVSQVVPLVIQRVLG